MRTIDRIFGWLMVAGSLYLLIDAVRHFGGNHSPATMGLGSALFEMLLASINLVRAERRHDLVLARICVFGNLIFLFLNVLDAERLHTPVLLAQAAITVALLLLSLRSRRRSRPM